MFNIIRQKFYTNLPFINFCIGISAFTFQLTVLNPWHSTISSQFDQLHKQIQQNQQNQQNQQIQQIQQIQQKSTKST